MKILVSYTLYYVSCIITSDGQNLNNRRNKGLFTLGNSGLRLPLQQMSTIVFNGGIHIEQWNTSKKNNCERNHNGSLLTGHKAEVLIGLPKERPILDHHAKAHIP